MKNVLVVDGALNAVYDIFQATDEEFALIFPVDHDIAFAEDLDASIPAQRLEPLLAAMWSRRIAKPNVMGIHGTLFVGLESKKQYYPTRRDEEEVSRYRES